MADGPEDRQPVGLDVLAAHVVAELVDHGIGERHHGERIVTGNPAVGVSEVGGDHRTSPHWVQIEYDSVGQVKRFGQIAAGR